LAAPFSIDVSRAAARELDMIDSGTATVSVVRQ
jgi:rare lipoprotein A (peptidoglycan hydrolase)